MGVSVTFSFANARDVLPAPCDGDARGLRQKMLDVYRENDADILTVLVTLRHERRRGLFLDVTLTDDAMTAYKFPFTDPEKTNPENGTRETIMGFRLTRGMIYRPKANITSLEKLIDEARLYPI